MFKYYPISQIKPNQLTPGGEFYITSTGEEYIGEFYQTSSNRFYTGKNSIEGESIPLTPTIIKKTNDFNKINNLSTPLENPIFSNNSHWTLDYKASPSPQSKAPSHPKSFYPKLIEEDYVRGEFGRYFLSKINEPKFIEVDLSQYDLYISKDPKVAFKLYQPLKVNWVISGIDRNKVHATNHKSVKNLEKSSNSPGFTSYFKGRFSLFYK